MEAKIVNSAYIGSVPVPVRFYANHLGKGMNPFSLALSYIAAQTRSSCLEVPDSVGQEKH